MPRSTLGTVTRKAANAFILIGASVAVHACRLPRRKDADVSSAVVKAEDNLRIHCKCDARNEWLLIVIEPRRDLGTLRPWRFDQKQNYDSVWKKKAAIAKCTCTSENAIFFFMDWNWRINEYDNAKTIMISENCCSTNLEIKCQAVKTS